MTQENILPEAAQGKKLIIFGARNFGKLLANTLQQNALDFAYFVDNCPRGGYVLQKPVFLPAHLQEEDKASIFILIASAFSARAIGDQLETLGFEHGKHFMDAMPWIDEHPYRATEAFPYEAMRRGIRYAPWHLDPDFVATQDAVRDNTLVDIHRLWYLWTLAGEAAKSSDGALVEVGVWRGGSGCMLAKRWQLLGKDTPVYLCDTFSGVVKAGEKDTLYVGGEHADTSRSIVEQLIRKMRLTNVRILQGIFPDETGDQLDAQEIAFCHIDVDVYQSGKDVFEFLWPRIASGGIVVFDDYGFMTTEGIRSLLDELKERQDLIFFAGLSGQGILIKR